jgi:hypothetical protein
VATNTGRLADSFKKPADESKPIRMYSQTGVLKRWKKWQEEIEWRAADSWRNKTPGEQREITIRWNPKDAEGVRKQWEADHGGVGNPGASGRETARSENQSERENRTEPRPKEPRTKQAGRHAKLPAAARDLPNK